MSTNHENDPGRKARKDAGLDADLEQIWQDESPMTAQSTSFADEVDGELGTRRRAGSKGTTPTGAPQAPGTPDVPGV